MFENELEDEKFNKVYSQVKDDLKVLQNDKTKNTMKTNIIMIVIIACMFLIFKITKIDWIPNQLVLVLLFIIFILSVVTMVVNNRKSNDYMREYNQKVLLKVIKSIAPDVEYYPEGSISNSIYNQANFINDQYDKYSSTEYIKFKNKNCEVNVSNIILTKEEYDKQINQYYNKHTFLGIYAYVPINKIVDRIYIDKNKQNIIKTNNQVNLDNEIFEKNFNVYSENSVLTMRLLTPNVMENMIKFTEKNNINFDIVIMNDKIHFKFSENIRNQLNQLYLVGGTPQIKESYLKWYYNVLNFINEIAQYLSETISNMEI